MHDTLACHSKHCGMSPLTCVADIRPHWSSLSTETSRFNCLQLCLLIVLETLCEEEDLVFFTRSYKSNPPPQLTF